MDDTATGSSQASCSDVGGPAILCPLCDYDLRGLAESRCPECGYRFVWADLLNRKLNTHPYLFEHHPKREIWSFVQTFAHGCNVGTFWNSLRPQMKPNLRRLLIYWLICTTAPAAIGVAIELILLKFGGGNRYAHRRYALYILARSFPGTAGFRTWRYVNAGLFAHLDYFAPILFFLSLLAALWTLLTYLALLVFQQSIAKAKIKSVHIARCVCYSFDIGIWLAVFSLVIMPLQFSIGATSDTELGLWLLTAAVLCVGSARLWIAYRIYLGFDHAFWVVLSSQIICCLVLFKILLDYRLVG